MQSSFASPWLRACANANSCYSAYGTVCDRRDCVSKWHPNLWFSYLLGGSGTINSDLAIMGEAHVRRNFVRVSHGLCCSYPSLSARWFNRPSLRNCGIRSSDGTEQKI